MTKWTAALTALALAAATAAPAPAFARAYHGGYRHYSHGRYHHHGDEAVAAGAIGLVLGLALGAALSDPGPPRARCYENYQRCPGPYYGPPPRPDRGYYDKDDYEGYAPGDDRRADYDRDYGDTPSSQRPGDGGSCIHPARTWDPHSGTYVWVNVRTC